MRPESKPIDLEDSFFTDNNPEVQEILKFFEDEKNRGSRIYISDLCNEKGHQYIDLVQKGGGVWGIALIGFTYILETVGIRFLRLAGTSAGAINTVLMAAMGVKEEQKSKRLIEMLANKNIFDFVDGHKVVKSIIRILGWLKNPRIVILTSLKFYFGILLLSLISLFLKDHISHELHLTGFITFFLFLIAGIFGAISISTLWKRFNEAGLGLNPGESFLFWMQKTLRNIVLDRKDPNENLTTDEIDAIAKDLSGIKFSLKKLYQPELETPAEDLEGGFIVITSDSFSENKIELPAMKDLFIQGDGTNLMNDAASLVRASMAIPLFFESFYIKNIDQEVTKDSWDKFFKIPPPSDEKDPLKPTIPSECRLVDGGLLSNFPVDVFINTQIQQIRFPTIGVNLTELSEVDINKSSDTWDVFKFLAKLFNAARNHHDKNFILKNSAQRECIADVHIEKIHWLDFSLSDDKKLKLFNCGAKAAQEFLEKFLIDINASEDFIINNSRWERIKRERINLHNQMLN